MEAIYSWTRGQERREKLDTSSIWESPRLTFNIDLKWNATGDRLPNRRNNILKVVTDIL